MSSKDTPSYREIKKRDLAFMAKANHRTQCHGAIFPWKIVTLLDFILKLLPPFQTLVIGLVMSVEGRIRQLKTISFYPLPPTNWFYKILQQEHIFAAHYIIIGLNHPRKNF
jgi:hypothetical protein